MLFIFHVETGTMMTLDINLALESVGRLKEEIQSKCNILVDKQVLLVSGGECLEPTARVCSYSAGTDTNPIFLFSKTSIESTTPPNPSIDYGPDTDFKEELELSLNLQPSINTVTVRTQLAQQMCEMARHQANVCEKLVHDQHMQQQGWAAVIANLDDITSAFRTRSENVNLYLKQHLDTREQFINILDSFEGDVATLSKIPVLPALIDKEEMERSSSSDTSCTLLQWISSKDNQSSLDQVSEQCRKGLDQFDEKMLDSLKSEVKSVLDAAQTSELREIKGLGERLFGLEKLKTDTKNMLQEQTELAQSFLANQARASHLGDTSILPDLCTSHKRQLGVMSKNHNVLRDIRRRCAKAKQELSANIYHRLKWVMFVESRVCEIDMKLMMYHESVKRLRRHLEVLSQIHLAPNVYLTAVAEVVRRRTFSQAFLVWANDLACQLFAVHSEEVARRKTFQSQFEGHFLLSLFPGLEDSPPPFATQAPAPFDIELPKLSVEDIERLRKELPDLALSLSIPDLSTITQFFLNRSISNLKPDAPIASASVEDTIVQVVNAAGLTSNLDPALLQQPSDTSQSLAHSVNTTHPISSDRGFESETDTDEFEKVGTPTETNKTENELREKMKLQLMNINSALQIALNDIRNNMCHMKQWVHCERNDLDRLLQCLSNAYQDQNEQLLQEIERRKESEIMLQQRLKRALESEERERIIREDLERRLAEMEKVMRDDLEMRMEAERENNKKMIEQLDRDHRNEVDALRCRFKFYSQNLEKSYSDFNLEKIEQSSLNQHENIISLLRENMLNDKQVEIVVEIARRLTAQKDREIDTIREREKLLDDECAKLKEDDMISDSSPKNNSAKSYLLQRMRDLENDNKRMKQELNLVKCTNTQSFRTISPTTSIVTIQSSVSGSGCRDMATSPDPLPRNPFLLQKSNLLSASTKMLIEQGKITISTCNKGDNVLVMWNDARKAYDIVQDSSKAFYLHTDYIERLGLQRCANTKSRRNYNIGQVANKEYCLAKKSKNRYNVPEGSKFFRVAVLPISSGGDHSHGSITTDEE